MQHCLYSITVAELNIYQCSWTRICFCKTWRIGSSKCKQGRLVCGIFVCIIVRLYIGLCLYDFICMYLSFYTPCTSHSIHHSIVSTTALRNISSAPESSDYSTDLSVDFSCRFYATEKRYK